MKYLFQLAILCLAILFFNCDGRERMKKTPKEVLQEHKLLDSFSENIKYFPESYNQVETDTTMASGFRVHILNYTDMNSAVLNEFETDSIGNKHYYRDQITHIEVAKNDELIFEKALDKLELIALFPDNKPEILASQLSGSWLNQEHSNDQKVILELNLCRPESDICLFYNLIVEENGSYQIIEVEPEEII